ncbi:hypothetical protein AB0J80_35460 [Actinoplanes sp. NPDC049548]|uniref:hypothetical protein n=1 Tax=Actinoplanes sp. NPDC049548 TaxID=3155152 RepID=UPI00342B33FC
MSDTSAIEAHLQDLGADPPIHDFVMALADHEDVWGDRQGAYLSLRPTAQESPIAVYVYRDRLEICLEPHRASVRAGSLDGGSVKSPSPATSHWVVPAAVLGTGHDKVMDGAREAVRWRRDGVRFPQPGKTSRKAGQPADEDFCPVHFIPRRMCECDD